MKTNKELYQVFEVDTCTQSFVMEYCLIGAIDVEDLINHLPDILKEKGIMSRERKELMKQYKEFKPEAIKGTYTDTPYIPLTSYGYYE